MVSGGPGTGKTETLVARAVWLLCERSENPSSLLVVAATEESAAELRRRLAHALVEEGASARLVRRVLAGAAPATAIAERLIGMHGAPESAEVTIEVPDDALRELCEALGPDSDPADARRLLLEAARRLASSPGVASGAASELYGVSAMMRLGVAAVEELRRDAEAQIYRRLRSPRGEDDPLGNLGLWLRRPADVRKNLPNLWGAISASAHPRAAGDSADLERLRALAHVVSMDMTDVARREAMAAPARALVYRLAATLVRNGGSARAIEGLSPASRAASMPQDPAVRAAACGGLRHVLVDDAQNLAVDQVAMLRSLASHGTLFVVGDPGLASCSRARRSAFEDLLRSVRRGTMLLAAPRYAQDCGRFVNAVGVRLWPASCGAGYAPPSLTSSRLTDGPAVELALTWRRVDTEDAANQHPEPLADARRREADAVAARLAALLRDEPSASCAILTLAQSGRLEMEAALRRRGIGSAGVDVLTIDRAQSREWDTVVVAQLDDHFGRHGDQALIDPFSGLPLVSPVATNGELVRPVSTVLLLDRAAEEREQGARRRFFRALTRGRRRLVLSGLTRDRMAGGRAFTAPIEWLRRELGVMRLRRAAATCRLDNAEVRVTIVA